MRMRVEPASSAFSSSSFTTDAGRSTTSPAAIWLATLSGRTWILPMSQWSVASVTDSWLQRKGGSRLAVGASKTSVAYSFPWSVGMKHAILGAGAIGGLVGTVLSSLGEEVTVVVRLEKLPSYPDHLTLERPSGSLTVPAKAVAALTQPVDLLWIATKTYQLPGGRGRARRKNLRYGPGRGRDPALLRPSRTGHRVRRLRISLRLQLR